MCFLFFIVLIFQQLNANGDSSLECQKVSGNVYCLYGEGGNIGILSTDEGLLIVDSQFKSVADSVLKIVRTISTKEIKYLVNTHYHADHTGGNEIIGKNAEIIMHPDCKSIKQDLYKQAGINDIFLNNVTIWKKGMVIELGEEIVRLLHFGNAHTSGDLIVVFDESKVIHTGDLFFNGWPPYIDVDDSSNTKNWIGTIEMLCEKYPDHKFIPGHGKVADVKSYLDFAKYLKILRAEVAKAIEEGKSREEAIECVKINEYSHLRDPRSDDGLSIKKNIGWVYDEMTKQLK
jgi:glyoxylase-like metal-dependent hydrolase (beta-lactamase superfamily II)